MNYFRQPETAAATDTVTVKIDNTALTTIEELPTPSPEEENFRLKRLLADIELWINDGCPEGYREDFKRLLACEDLHR